MTWSADHLGHKKSSIISCHDESQVACVAKSVTTCNHVQMSEKCVDRAEADMASTTDQETWTAPFSWSNKLCNWTKLESLTQNKVINARATDVITIWWSRVSC